MQDKARIEKIAFGAVWIFLICYFMMLFDFPNILTILFGAVICLVLLVKQKKFRLDIGVCLLALTIASYFIIVYGLPRAFTMSLPYVGIIIYVLAHYLVCEVKAGEGAERKIILLTLAMVAGSTIHGILNSYCFLDGQLQDNNVRLWQDFWIDAYIPGTWQVVYFLPVLAMVFPAIVYFKERKWVNAAMFFSAVFFVYISMISQSRTSIIILPVVFCTQAFLYILLEREKLIKKLANRNVKIVGVMIIVLLAVGAIALVNSSLGQSFIAIMDRDGGIFNNVRFKFQRHALEQLFLYPMGGNQMDFLGYPHAHNTWLDIADTAGLIPFFSFAAYTVLIVYELIRWLLKKEVSTERKLITAGLFGAFFLYNTVERGFGGSMHYMTPWFFLNGLVHGELSMLKKKIEK